MASRDKPGNISVSYLNGHQHSQPFSSFYRMAMDSAQPSGVVVLKNYKKFQSISFE
ncbi:MAG: hypothetical protein K2U26_13690 [Cyclobacteriaceae bacterium]|nr:hypothetical protein [Cyclobacteriaceae bacterium]